MAWKCPSCGQINADAVTKCTCSIDVQEIDALTDSMESLARKAFYNFAGWIGFGGVSTCIYGLLQLFGFVSPDNLVWWVFLVFGTGLLASSLLILKYFNWLSAIVVILDMTAYCVPALDLLQHIYRMGFKAKPQLYLHVLFAIIIYLKGQAALQLFEKARKQRKRLSMSSPSHTSPVLTPPAQISDSSIAKYTALLESLGYRVVLSGRSWTITREGKGTAYAYTLEDLRQYAKAAASTDGIEFEE